jgi:L-ascorbate metabolism protein UlaG (beta-lactamase superfamily)
VTEVSPEDRVQLAPGVEALAFPAAHDGSRQPFGPRSVPLGFVIEGTSTVYFAGDTDIFPEMERLRDRLDLALLPVWGWGPRMGPGHLNPRRAALATELMRPRLSIPIHWGTLYPIGMRRVWPHRLVEPPRDYARFVAESATPHEVLILRPGETTSLAHGTGLSVGMAGNVMADQVVDAVSDSPADSGASRT